MTADWTNRRLDWAKRCDVWTGIEAGSSGVGGKCYLASTRPISIDESPNQHLDAPAY